MRYLYEHSMTRELLAGWSGSIDLDLAAFFFWNIGTPEQRSQVGLLRPLLHHILSTQRDLIRVALRDRWNDELRNLRHSHFLEVDFEWNLHILRKAFDVIRSQSHLRVCLFVDGLDEYENSSEGSHSDIISFFERLTASGSFKACLSSRPWLVFEDSFRSCPTLQLQHLTRPDIVLYINDKLAGHKRMTELRIRDPQESDALIQEIVSKASGVFLWVKLVVKSLIDGFTNRDRIPDLQKRLLLLPPDLEDLYRHMFMNHIDPFYYEQSSRIFQVVCAAQAAHVPVHLFTLSCTEEEEDGLALKAQLGPWSDSEKSHKCHEMESRLKSRCVGLLEVSPVDRGPGMNPVLIVNFIHRTAYEFLELPEVWDVILSRTKTTFDPSLRLLEAYILLMKVSNNPGNDFHYSEHLQLPALMIALHAEKSSKCLDVQMLDELDKAAISYWLRAPRPKECSNAVSCHYCHTFKLENRDNFFCLAVSFCLTSYVKAKLLQDNTVVRKRKGKPVLEYIFEAHGGSDRPSVELVSLLLSYGADPNQQYLNRSFWQHILGCVFGDYEKSSQSLWKKSLGTHTARVFRFLPAPRERWLAVIKLFVEAGADPNALCHSVQSTDLRTNESSGSDSVGEESEKFVVQLITPLCFFTPEGPLPDLELENTLKSWGAIEFMELRDLKALDKEGRRAEALKIRDETVPQIKKRAKMPRSKGSWRQKFRMSWGIMM
jgi:hypothetical protein